MKMLIKIRDVCITIIGIALAIWLLAGLLGFWVLLPQNTLWLVIKVVSVALLVFVLIIRSEEAEDKTFKEQVTIIGKFILGFILVAIVGTVLLLILRGSGSPVCNYPWSSGCP